MKPAVEFEQVSKYFRMEPERPRSLQERFVHTLQRRRRAVDDVWVLRDVSFSLPAGLSLGIVGQNGAGKSSLLKLCARVIEPTAGVVRTQGRISALLELGVGFHPELTGRENVFLYGSLVGIPRTVMQRRFDEIVAFSEIERFIDLPVKVYSSGMYLRLAFAVAIHVEAEVLLLDEVFAVGDARFQRKCLERIRELQRDGVTLLFVSHDASLVRSFCQKALWIEDGRAVAFDDAENVVTAYSEQLADLTRTQEIQHDTHRWGTHEAEITQVTFINQAGETIRRIATGEALTVQLHYEAHQRIAQPSFGLAIHHSDGTHVNGPNTQFAGLEIPFIEGRGVIECRFEQLNLLPGEYHVSASVYDFATQYMYDYHHRVHPFWVDVRPGLNERYGVAYLPSTWDHHPEP
jgi:lipopolysaccharide transport system ATP-binding protein